MKKVLILLCLVITFYQNASSQIIDTIGTTTVRIDSLIGFTSNMNQSPWDLHWGPDNKLWYTMGNKVCRYDTASHNIDTLYKRLNVSGSYALSVATHPDFFTNPVVYVAYDTMGLYYASGHRIVLYKYNYSVSGDSLYNETEILSWYHGGEHSGGRLHVGIDNYLYVTTAEYWPSSDTAGNLSGRILRVNLDGTVPVINQSGDYDISYGHRNPQGIVQVPNGNIFASELGQMVDELNLIREGKNYGWPAFDGLSCLGVLPDSCTSPTFIHELPIDTAIRPPSGIDYYDHVAIPELQGCILQAILSFGGWQGGMVASKLNVAMDDVVSDIHYFKAEYMRWRDICVAPDGRIFAITNDRWTPVIRVIYNPVYHAGIEKNQPSFFSIYPNPADQFIIIKSEKIFNEWSVISVDGKEIMNGKNISVLFQVDISVLTPGIYFFKTKNGSEKFVKQ